MISNPKNWYWFVAGDTTQVYSSASHTFVLVADATYQAWLSAGGVTSSIASLGELIDVLASDVPSAIDEDVSTSSVNPTTGGPWTFLITAGRFFPIGGTLFIRPAADTTIALIGEVRAYSGTSLTVSLRATNATVSQAYDLWSIALLDSPPAELPIRSIVGLAIEQDSTDPHSFVVRAGSIMDSTGSVLLSLDSDMTKSLEAVWAAGDAQGGAQAVLLSGTLSNTSNTITGVGTAFTSDFANGLTVTLNDYRARGGRGLLTNSGYTYNLLYVPSATSQNVARIFNASSATSMTGTGQAISPNQSGVAYYRGGPIRTGYTWSSYLIYFVVLMRKDSDGSVDWMFCPATVSGEPDLPSGYTFYGVLGYIDITPNATKANSDVTIYQHLYALTPVAQKNARYVTWFAESSLPNSRIITGSTSAPLTVTGSYVSVERAALTGDVTASANSNTTTIAAGAVTYAKMASGVIREKLTANRTYYVRTDGSDSNTGLANTSGGAFLTIAKAVSTIAALDQGGFNITIQVGAGTYSAGIAVDGIQTGQGGGTITFVGDATTPTNVVLSTSSSNAVVASNGARIQVSGFSLVCNSGGASCIYAAAGSRITISGKMDFGAAALAHIYVEPGARVNSISVDYAISGGAVVHWYSIGTGAQISIQVATITLTGTPAFSGAFAISSGLAHQLINANTFSGSATGSRYTVALNAVIDSNGGGANYLPGNAAGSTGTGGQYG